MRMPAQVDQVAKEDDLHRERMERVHLRVGGFRDVSVVVPLDGLFQKRKTNEKKQRERDPQPAPASVYAGFHLRIGLRAAITSSTRLVLVPCGAFLMSCGSVSTSLAIEIIASMNWSISRLPSVSVGSI